MIPFDQINAVALSRWPLLVADWLPAGRKHGNEWVLGSLDGARGRSLSINLNTGKWADFSSDQRGGDPISLYAALHHNGDRVAAARELGTILHVTSDTIDPAPASPSTVAEWVPHVRPPADARAPDWSGWDHVYVYRDANGFPERYVMRRDATETDRKRIMPLTWGVLQGRAGWHLRHAASPRSLYGLDRIARCSTVVVCEGEKAADAAQAMFPKMACTTWTAGTGNVSRADWSALAGKKVIIWPDNDEPGEKAAAEIRDILSGIAASVRMVNVSDLDPGADAADLRVEDVREWFRSHVGPILCGASVKRPPESAPIQQLGRRAAGLEPIQVRAGEIDLVATAGERALMAANAPV